MCVLCEERFATASRAVDEIIRTQEEYRELVPERTEGQRVSDLANVFLTGLVMTESTPISTVETIQNTALYLAAMTERILEMKREANVR